MKKENPKVFSFQILFIYIYFTDYSSEFAAATFSALSATSFA